MPRLIHLDGVFDAREERRTGTVARRAISSSASMGVGVLIGAFIIALLGIVGFAFWRRTRRTRRTRIRRAKHFDPTLSAYAHGHGHPHKDTIPISPFLAHHEEMMIQRPVLHITHSPPPTAALGASATKGMVPGSALDDQGRWTGRMPHTPNSADPLLTASALLPSPTGALSPSSAGPGTPSGSGAGSSSPSAVGSGSTKTRTRTPPIALTLDRARAATVNAHVRQSVNGTVEVTVDLPPPVPAICAVQTAEPSKTSRHPYAGQTTEPVPPPRATIPSSSRGRRSSTEKDPQFFVHNRTSSPPVTPAPRYSILGRLSTIGGLFHAPPTALPAYRSSLPRQTDNTDQRAAAGPSGHGRQDSGRLLPPCPPPSGPVPMPPDCNREG